MKDRKGNEAGAATRLRRRLRERRAGRVRDIGHHALRGAAYQAGSGIITVLILWIESRR
ncbi:hypothetical protein SCHAM137S_01998 [Streptomyces chartreusis]|nr:hypothetical protein SAMN05216482_0041 [Streptomyces sp. PAN_FS17]